MPPTTTSLRFMVAIYSVTIFVSAGLLFSVQPMIGKMLLPRLGGTPAVWNTCLVFFQALLLLGYYYAHESTRRLGIKTQAAVHLGLLLLPLFWMPIALRTADNLNESSPSLLLVAMLLPTVGAPFLAVATSAPLMQKWFAGTGHPAANDPYFLYAASNAGSLIALLGYPLVLEPTLTLAEQSSLWRAGYLLLVGLIAFCALVLWRSRPTVEVAGTAGQTTDERVTLARRLRWMACAFIPSSLMLGVTTYVTTDIAAFPLLWVIPLSLYLLTFILAFARRQFLPRTLVGRAFALLAIPAVIALIVEANYPHYVLIPEHLLLFFGASLLCHGALANDRPGTKHLTEYYLCMSLGGVLGGAFNTFLAPLLFPRILEYPLMIVLACLFRPAIDPVRNDARARRLDVLLPIGLTLLTAALAFLSVSLGFNSSQAAVLLTFALPAVLVLSSADRPLRYALGLGALLAGSIGYVGPLGKSIDTERNFFGVVRVTDDSAGAYRLMVHGNTVHGSESLDPARRGLPMAYYHHDGPAGDIFRAFQDMPSKRCVGVIGLGAGSLASYAKPDQSWTFYEINPAVVRFAETPEYFTFLSRSAAHQMKVAPGDARISLGNEKPNAYGLLVLDAFSSDAIPVHLVTLQALELYVSKLDSGGMLAFHITNRYLDLEPVFGKLASELGLIARTRNELESTEDLRATGREPSQWLVMARSEAELGAIRNDPAWRDVKVTRGMPVWTDDFSNLTGVLRW
ncbi:MAG TPA: fused MFS/spermidine synthase [Terriglobia bacterium]|nr:fused MFS/spermidine synthase [Terriglobia bacterium]